MPAGKTPDGASPGGGVLPQPEAGTLREAVAAFRRDLPGLLRTHPGQWVAYHGGRRIGFADSKTLLIRYCGGEGHRPADLFVAKVQPEMPPAAADWL